MSTYQRLWIRVWSLTLILKLWLYWSTISKTIDPFVYTCFFNETGVNISASLDSSLEKENLSHAVTPSSSEPSKKWPSEINCWCPNTSTMTRSCRRGGTFHSAGRERPILLSTAVNGDDSFCWKEGTLSTTRDTQWSNACGSDAMRVNRWHALSS